MRGTQALLVDPIERPEWVRDALDQITTRYSEAYGVLYDLVPHERGGSHFLARAPGRMSKFQCDFSAMISPQLFGEFMVPVLRALTERVDYCMYHWDGPAAIPHHDHLLSLPELTMIQWTSGAGTVLATNERWWPLYHKTVEAGRKLMIGVQDVEGLRALRREFGPKLKQFLISMRAQTLEQAREILPIVSD